MDLAPKYIYYYWMTGLFLGPVFVSFIIFKSPGLFDNESFPTTLIALLVIELVGLILLLTKCRYVVQSDDPKYFLFGDVSRQKKIQKDRLIIKKISKHLGLYKVDSGDTSFFILTENHLVDNYLN